MAQYYTAGQEPPPGDKTTAPQRAPSTPGPCPDTHRDVDVCVWLDDDGALQVCAGAQPDEYLTLTPGQAVVVRVRLRKPVVHDLPVVDVRGVADV